MGFSETLKLQAELAHWYRTPMGRKCTDGFVESMAMANQSGGAGDLDLAKQETDRLLVAPSYWVNNEMTDFFDVAFRDMPPSVLLETDLLTSTGFAALHHSIYLKDIKDKQVSVKAISWGPGKQHLGPPGTLDYGKTELGVFVVMYSDEEDPADEASAMHRPVRVQIPGYPRLGILHFFFWPWGQTKDDWARRLETIPQKTFDHYKDVADRDKIIAAITEQRQMMAAFWHITSTKISDISPAPARKQARKAAAKEGIVIPEVKIITLRRKQRDSDGEPEPTGTVDWTHRWIVGPHWQRYHTKDGVRARLKSQFVKGPEDKPLIIKKKIYKVVR